MVKKHKDGVAFIVTPSFLTLRPNWPIAQKNGICWKWVQMSPSFIKRKGVTHLIEAF
jgi:hypothetical protein